MAVVVSPDARIISIAGLVPRKGTSCGTPGFLSQGTDIGSFRAARSISIAGPRPRKGTSRGTPDLLSHDTDRRALHLLQRGRPERRAHASPAARAALFIADVRTSLRPAFRSLSPCRARLPRLRTQRLAGPEQIRVHLRSHRGNHESLHRSARSLPL